MPDAALAISPGLISAVRRAALWELARASEAVVIVAQTPGHLEHPEWYRTRLAELDAVRALLDDLGWDDEGDRSGVRLDMSKHGFALREVLGTGVGEGRTCTDDARQWRRLQSIISAQEGTAGRRHRTPTPGAVRSGARPGLAKSAAAASDAQGGRLTARETEILHHLSQSRRYAEIAVLLSIDIETVRTHARHIRRKLDVGTSRDLAGLYVPAPNSES